MRKQPEAFGGSGILAHQFGHIAAAHRPDGKARGNREDGQIPAVRPGNKKREQADKHRQGRQFKCAVTGHIAGDEGDDTEWVLRLRDRPCETTNNYNPYRDGGGNSQFH